MKTCSRCGVSKSIDEFYRNSTRSDGRQAYCKACSRDSRTAYRRANPEAAASYQRQWALRNPDKVREKDRRNREAKPHLAWARKYRFRARRFGFDPVVVLFTKSDLIAAYGDACAYCGGAFEEIDHVTPVISGGHHVLENVRPSCTACNRAKKDRAV